MKARATALALSVAIIAQIAPASAQTTVAGVTPGALAVDAQGQANYSVPIDVPPGIAGMEPSLSLNYSSGAGNGIAGVGWSLGGLSAITRCPRTPAQDGAWGGIEYNDNDRFCLDGKRLVAVNGAYGADGTEYRTEIDGFFRIVSYGKVVGSTGLQGTSPVWFRVWAKSGQVMDYGASEDSRIEAVFTPAPAPEAPPEVRAWAVGRIADTVGNYMIFSYFEDPLAGAHRLDRIDYTYNDAAGVAGQSSVQFVYEARPDTASGYPGGSLITSDVRLASVRTFTDGALVRDYRLAYETGAATGRSRLLSVTECDGTGGTESCLAPTTFAWKAENAGFTADPTNYALPAEVGSVGEGAFVDVNGDGLVDFVRAFKSSITSYRNTWINTGSGWYDTPDFVPPFDITVNDADTPKGRAEGEFVDLNGDGLPDFVRAVTVRFASYQAAWINTGSGWEASTEYQPPFVINAYSYSAGCDGDSQQCTVRYGNWRYGDFVDADGDGLADFVQAYGTSRITWLNTGNGWLQSTVHSPPFSSYSGKRQETCSGFSSGPVIVDFSTCVTSGHLNELGSFLDLDGDGLTDYIQATDVATRATRTCCTSDTIYNGAWLNTGSGWQLSPARQPPFLARKFITDTKCDRDGICTTTYSGEHYGDFIDANADGLADFVQAYKSGNSSIRSTWINTGAGWIQDLSNVAPYDIQAHDSLTPATEGGRREVEFVDVNGDGLNDAVRAINVTVNATRTCCDSSTNYQNTWLSTGAGWQGSALYMPPYLLSKYVKTIYCDRDGVCTTTYSSQTNGAYADVNGDGVQDFVEHSPGDNGVRDTWLANSAAPDQLLSVTDSLGSTTTLTYARLNDPAATVYQKLSDAVFPVQDVQGPMYVVSEVAREDGAGGEARTTYRYAGAKADTTGRGFLGFRAMEATDQQTGIVTTTTYAQAFPFIGQVEATETFIPDPSGATAGTMLSRTTNTLAELSLNLGASVFPYVSQSVAESFEANDGPGNAAIVVTTSASTYDDYGNPTQVSVATAGGGESFTTTTANIYTNDTVNWFLGRLTRATVTNTLPDLRSATRVSAFAYDPLTGLLTQEVIEPDDPVLTLTTDYGHDAFGHRVGVTVSGADIATRTTTTDYPAAAPNFGRFATSATNALGHTETRGYDARFGTVASLTGPNGITTSWQYDGFGRKLLETRADGTETRWSYELCTTQCTAGAVHAAAAQNFLSAAGTPIDARKVTYFDALNRAFRSETQGFDGTPVYADTVFDALGRVERVSRPYFAGTPALDIQWTVTTYDAIGRPKTVTAPDGGVEGMAYDGLTTIATNALGQTETRVENAIGQLARSVDDEGNSVLNGYDAFGNLERSEVLPAGAAPGTGVVTTMSYDIRGRKRAMDDPDMGLWTYDYDVLGQLVRQTDAKGQAVTMQYDLLGRMTLRGEAEGTTTWTYDNSLKTAAIGKPDRVSRSQDDYVEDYTYDSLGRPLETAVTFEGRTYATTTSYDSAGRPALLTYPVAGDGSRFAVENVYTALGHLAAVQEPGGLGTVYWRADSVDAEGRVTAETLGNGLVTQRDFDPTSGLVQAIRVFDGLTAIKDQGFAFDHIGNLTSRTDALRNRREDFAYDGLNRVTQATVTDTATLAQLSQATTSYDALGNITFKSDVGGYLYNGVDGGPHAVTQAGDTTYRYDANGSMVSSEATMGGAIIRTITWSSFNKPVRIEGAGGAVASEFVHGPGRARVKQTLFEGTTAVKTVTYLGAFERHAVPGQADELVHYIAAGGTVAIYTKVDDGAPATDRMRYLHKDHLGSVDLVTDGAGLVAESRSFDPWGRARNADWTPAAGELPMVETKRGFTGHEHLDSVGLIHMNGRVYDPVIGRMLSADPIVQAPAMAQSHNRYTYVMNNPLSFTDPSGFWSLKKLLKGLKTLIKPAIAIAVAVWLGPIVYDKVFWFLAETTAFGVTAGSVIAGAATGATLGAITGGLYGGTAGAGQGALIGAFTGGLFSGVGEMFTGIQKVMAHGIVGGIESSLRGGKFAEGFGATVFGQLSYPVVRGFQSGLGRIMARAVAGGVGAELGGGKFANGAQSAAFLAMFDEVRWSKDDGRPLTANEKSEAQRIYGNKIKDYDSIRVYSHRWLPGQSATRPMAPDGNIYWPAAAAAKCTDLTTCYIGKDPTLPTFIHEMAHVMQFQNGVNVMMSALPHQVLSEVTFGKYDPYVVGSNVSSPTGLNVEAEANWYKYQYCKKYVC